MSTGPERHRTRIDWLATLLTPLAVLALSLPTAGLVMLFLGASHAADPRVPALGIDAVYPLVVAAWVVGWLVRIDVGRQR